MQAFILAGGFATRLWPLTEKRAKPLLPIAGTPLITYIVQGLPAEIPITLSTNAVFGADFERWKKDIARDMTISIEDAEHEDRKLGALGATAAWIEEEGIDDDVLLLAGDNYTARSLQDFLKLFRGNPLIAGHDIGSLDAARQFGTIITEKSDDVLKRVLSFEEKPQEPKSSIVSTGWWILPKSVLPALIDYAKEHPDNVGGVFEEFIKRKIAVDCFSFTETWRDIGSFGAYMSLHCELLSGKVQRHHTATVDSTSQLEGAVDIGPESTVEKSTLRNCILFGKTTVKDCILERCIIDEGCTLEGIDLTDKMLRAGTVLRRGGKE